MSKKNIYSVKQVNSYIRNMFLSDFLLNSVSIRGEVSNCKYHNSGHIYFTLKDDGGSLSCVMFASKRGNLTFRMFDGAQVIVRGSVDVYEREGKYQLYADSIEADGTGALYEKYEALKKELEEQGMFEPFYKREIPKYIETLGVVTAPKGAAVRDIIQISKRRNPYINIIVYPAKVQGDGAAESIVRGINALSDAGVDVIIAGRGGGSIEDLWAFNERIVAEAIFNCPVPVISAVGHETDTTIADFVADLRAPTPSAAAELAVFEYDKLIDRINDTRAYLSDIMLKRIRDKRYKLGIRSDAIRRLAPLNRIRERRTTLLRYEDKLEALMDAVLKNKRYRLELLVSRLRSNSPLDKISGGCGMISAKDGSAIKTIDNVSKGDRLNIYIKDGIINVVVDGTVKQEYPVFP